jgi:hypothetical protein
MEGLIDVTINQGNGSGDGIGSVEPESFLQLTKRVTETKNKIVCLRGCMGFMIMELD